jgi:hypothetical protein
MGYEAYKITAKFENVSKDGMTSALKECGGYVTEIFGNCVTMEISGRNGIIELVLCEPGHVNTRFSPGDKVLLTLRFSKPGNVRVANDVIQLLRRLTARFDTDYIRDTESGREMDLSDTGTFIKAVTYAKYNFEYYFPQYHQPLRCRDTFAYCRTVYPAAASMLDD